MDQAVMETTSSTEQDNEAAARDAALYDLLLLGDIKNIQKFAQEHYDRDDLNGTELMGLTVHVIESCVHGYQFESFRLHADLGDVELDVGTSMRPSEWIKLGQCNCCQHDLTDERKLICRYEVGVYPMHVAVLSINPYDVIDYLLCAGSDINVQTLHHNFTILRAFLKQVSADDEDKAIKMIDYLVKQGFDILQGDEFGRTVLHLCVKRGLGNVLAYLLRETKARSLINTRTCSADNGYTPLFLAVKKKKIDMLKLLLTYDDVDVNARDKHDQTPLMEALYIRNLEAVHLLMEKNVEVNFHSMHGYSYLNSALHLAVQLEDEDIVTKLLDRGADPNIRTEEHETVLYLAVIVNSVPMASLLIERGADVNICNDQLYSPLHTAAWDGHEELVRLLLQSGAEHDNRCQDGNTPLSLACHGNKFSIVQRLLSLGCNVNNQDKDADTPLHYATFNGSMDTVRALCDHGALPDLPNRLNTTPLWNAAHVDRNDMMRYLLQYNPDIHVCSTGIDQHALTDAVVPCFSEPRSVLYVAGKACSYDNASRREVFKMLIAAGLNVSREQWLVDARPFWMDGINDWLEELLHTPLSLITLCRTVIRDMLREHGGDFQQHVVNLEIPETLKAFLITHDLYRE